MFSGLTNQVTSWMGAVKGEQGDEEVPQPAGGASEPSDLQTQPEEGGGSVDQAQAAFENVPVGDGSDENGAKATRFVSYYYDYYIFDIHLEIDELMPSNI